MTMEYRDKNLEKALLEYAVAKTGKKEGLDTFCVLYHCLKKGIDSLDELNTFVKSKIGRGIEADDFCKLSNNAPNPSGNGLSVFAYGLDKRLIMTLTAFCRKEETYFSADALMMQSQEGDAFMDNLKELKQARILEDFLNQDLWEDNMDELEKLSDQTGGSIRDLMIDVYNELFDRIGEEEHGFERYRSFEFEQALFDFEAENPGITDKFNPNYILQKAVTDGRETLSKLDEYMQKKIGRGIEPDDFCRIQKKGFYNNKYGLSALMVNSTKENIATISEFCINSDKAFSPDALLLKSENGDHYNVLDEMHKTGTLKFFLNYRLWKDNLDVLENVAAHVSDEIKDEMLKFVKDARAFNEGKTDLETYRGMAFEQALADFDIAKPKGVEGSNLYFAAKKGNLKLDELSKHLKKKIGRYLEADDFCRLAQYPLEELCEAGTSCFTSPLSKETIENMLDFCKLHDLRFTAKGLLIRRHNSQDEPSCIDVLFENGHIDLLLAPELWSDNLEELEQLSMKTEGKLQRKVQTFLNYLTDLNNNFIKGFDKYRDDAFEKVLENIRERNPNKNFGNDVLAACIKNDNLDVINESMKKEIGRGLQADDFCKLSKNSGKKDVSALTFRDIANHPAGIFAYCMKEQTFFSANALLIKSEANNATAVDALYQKQELQKLFQPELWENNYMELLRLQRRLKGDGEKLATRCVEEVRRKPQPVNINSVTLTKESLTREKDGRPAALSNPVVLQNIIDVQKNLTRRGQPLSWHDMITTLDEKGRPVAVKAAETGDIEKVAIAIENSAGTLTLSDLTQKLQDGKTIAEALHEKGGLVTVLEDVAMPASDIIELDRTVPIKKDPRLSGVILRHIIRKAREDQAKAQG